MSISVKFFYKDSPRLTQHEAVITAFCLLAAEVIELPETLEVCLYKLPDNVYGGIDYKINRIALNSSLLLKDVPSILAHELIHVNQKVSGALRITPGGQIYWRTIPYKKILPETMDFDDYLNLPWEVDVQNRQEDLIEKVLHLHNNSIDK